MNKYLISIIIPTYKPLDYLYECLDSIAHQTFSPSKYEIILVLNGCCEPWKSDIKQYNNQLLSQLNIKFIQVDTGGVSNARNIGIDNSEGEFITFIDDDDYITPTYLEDLYSVSDRYTIGVARPVAFNDTTKSSVFYPITKLFDKFYPKKNIPFIRLRRYFIGPCMKLIHRDIINKRRFNPSFSVGEDGLFMFLISDEFNKCSLANNRAIYYRRYREGSLVSKRTKDFIKNNNKNLLRETWNIYKSKVRRYNFIFFLMQISSYIKSILW